MKNLNFFYIFFSICCLLIFLRLEIIFGSDIRAPFTDDFYYYLTTARNFVNSGHVSFDNISLTNGFQPLWFFYISIILSIFKNEILFNIIIICSIFIFSFLTYFNFKKFFLSEGYNFKESNFISSLISYLTLFFSKNGMEIAIAMFFFSLSLSYFRKNIFVFIFFSFLTFLSRLEFIIFYFVLLSNDFFIKLKLFDKNYFFKLLIFPFLILVYIFTNLYFFGLPLPESGLAKSLNHKIIFNKETFLFLISDGYGMKFISLLFYINLISITFIFSKQLKSFTKIALLTSIIFFIANSLRSAWPLWTWHFFFLSISTPLILNDIGNYLSLRYKSIFTNLIGLFFVISYSFLFFINFNINNDHILNLAKEIEKSYGSSKYEIFAMGDMAGKVSYLLNKNLIQLEGLVGGKKILINIQNEENLCNVFNELNVEIYLTSKLINNNGEFYIEEPSQYSKNIKKMKGVLKINPEKIFNSGSLNIYAFNLKNKKFC